MIEFFQRLPAGQLEWHRHSTAYAAIVLSGGYIERGDTGRWQIEPGDIVSHKAFEAHSNIIGKSGARVANIALPAFFSMPSVFQVAEPDQIIRRVQSRSVDMLDFLVPTHVKAPLRADWPDILAEELRRAPVSLGHWSSKMNLAPATVSRGFFAAFGTTPARYRVSVQTISALQMIKDGALPFCEIAQLSGFSDQPHMCRAIMRMTGRTPTAWRKIKTVQDGAIEDI
jgi:AraC-like DNA-binding protein